MVKARQIWFKVLDSQMETGTPYLLYKDVAILNQIKKILVQLKVVIFVQKLLNILTVKKVVQSCKYWSFCIC